LNRVPRSSEAVSAFDIPTDFILSHFLGACVSFPAFVPGLLSL
jgi:hypothetical protein